MEGLIVLKYLARPESIKRRQVGDGPHTEHYLHSHIIESSLYTYTHNGLLLYSLWRYLHLFKERSPRIISAPSWPRENIRIRILRHRMTSASVFVVTLWLQTLYHNHNSLNPAILNLSRYRPAYFPHNFPQLCRRQLTFGQANLHYHFFSLIL